MYISQRMLAGLILSILGIMLLVIWATLWYKKNKYAMLPGMLGTVTVVVGILIMALFLFY